MQKAPETMAAQARLHILATPQGPLWHWYFLQSAAMPSEHAEHQHKSAAPTLREAYVSASSGEAVLPLDYVRALTAAVAPGAKWLTCEPVTTFNSEYGFAQKRLPVYKVQLDAPGHLAVYVDPLDAAVAAVVRDLDRAEGFSFGYLHKAAWLDALGKNTRDALLGTFALLIFAMTCVGLSFLRRRSPR